MAARWLALALLPTAGAAVAQPPVSPAAAPPSAVVAPAARPPEWPREVGGKSIDYYIGELSSPDPTVREQAIKTLPYFGPLAARKAAPRLIAAVADPDPGVKVNAMLALQGVGFDGSKDVQAATQALRTTLGNTLPGSVIRLHATRLLGAIGPDAHAAVETLVAISRDPSWETRDAVAAALGRVGAPVYDPTPQPAGSPPAQPKRAASPAARARLFQMLKDDSKAVRLEAITALMRLGTPTATDPDQYGREAAPCLEAVAARLAPGTDKAPGEKDPSVRLWLQTLTIMYDAQQAGPAVTELQKAVSGTDPAVRVQGLTALTLCESLAAAALPEVRLALVAGEPEVVRAAVACVAAMGPEGRKALPDLQALAAGAKDPDIKAMAEEAIRRLQPGAAPKR